MAPLPQISSVLPKVASLDVTWNSRVDQTWEPLIQEATQLGDVKWLAYAEAQKALAALKLREMDPDRMVYLGLLTCALNGTDKDRVPLRSLRRHLRGKGKFYNDWQLSCTVQRLGFMTTRTGGQMFIQTGGIETLRRVGKLLKVDDEWLSDSLSGWPQGKPRRPRNSGRSRE